MSFCRIKIIDHLDTAKPDPDESDDNRYTTSYLIATLQALQAEMERAPTVDDIRNLSETLPDVSTYERRFGSWIDALEAAGIEGAHNRTDETILRQLARLTIRLDRAPTKREVDADDTTASSGLYRNRFGSFSRAVNAALDLAQELNATINKG